MGITPDTKDWTWVLERPCPECGFDASAVEPAQLGARIRATLPLWPEILSRADATTRPRPEVWSPVEYACHVRDVFRVFDERVRLMLDEDEPQFANWDQDASAIVGRYGEQDPATVVQELLAAGDVIAARFDSVPDDAWARRGRRSNGSILSGKPSMTN